jgi:gamma-glutamyltranspeptidase/glutathione hydrolase
MFASSMIGLKGVPVQENILMAEQGPKDVVRGARAVCSTDNSIVTHTIADILLAGGSAADAAVAGALAQAAVQPAMTNHAGTVTCLVWNAKERQALQLASMGKLVPHLPPFRPVPGVGVYSPPGGPYPMACIPGFIPGLAALHDRFGKLPWSRLCKPAIHWAEEGHVVSSFEYGMNSWTFPFSGYFPEGRKLYAPDGFLVPVGQRFRNPALAQSLEDLEREGPSHFTTGGWAREFVATANAMGWPIELADMALSKPEWAEPLVFSHGEDEIVQLAPPEIQGVFCALVLGVLGALGVRDHAPEDADAIGFIAHTLRWAQREIGYLHDPAVFTPPLDLWLDPDYHHKIARLIASTRPRQDLTDHVALSSGNAALAHHILMPGGTTESKQPAGSCEISVVDSEGNWVQLMNTLQGGGIPGAVVGGVPMVGSHALLGQMSSSIMGIPLAGWLAKDTQIRSVMGNTLVMRGGEPRMALGTPGRPDCMVAQVLHNILDCGMDPYSAIDAPRMAPLEDDYGLTIESRLSNATISELTRRGFRLRSAPPYDWHFGSFQICWRDPESGLLNGATDPRRCGLVRGLQ